MALSPRCNQVPQKNDWLLCKLGIAATPWQNMSREQRHAALLTFMQQRFSGEPLPEDAAEDQRLLCETRLINKTRESDILSWRTFHMTGAECIKTARAVMDQYDVLEHRCE